VAFGRGDDKSSDNQSKTRLDALYHTPIPR